MKGLAGRHVDTNVDAARVDACATFKREGGPR
jgi:hypothetical protein